MRDKKDFAARFLMLMMDNITCIDNWGIYFFDSDFDKERELRNKIGAIWFSSLYDSLDAERRVLEEYKKHAIEQSYTNMINLCNIVNDLFLSVTELLSSFSKPEQLFIQHFRDALVHSWLHKHHNDSFYIRYVENLTLVTEKILHKDFHDIIRPFYYSGFEDNLESLRIRFTDTNLQYWALSNYIRENRHEIAKGIYADIGVSY